MLCTVQHLFNYTMVYTQTHLTCSNCHKMVKWSEVEQGYGDFPGTLKL
jgi:predicted HNH restriction endonuclease